MKLSERMKRANSRAEGEPIIGAPVGAWADEVAQLESENERLQEAMDLIAQDALWHDGASNPEALEDIRKTVKSLGYVQGITERESE